MPPVSNYPDIEKHETHLLDRTQYYFPPIFILLKLHILIHLHHPDTSTELSMFCLQFASELHSQYRVEVLAAGKHGGLEYLSSSGISIR